MKMRTDMMFKSVRDFTCIQLVYGQAGKAIVNIQAAGNNNFGAGNGKTHYIKKQLAKCSQEITIAVNEGFSTLKAITKLRHSLLYKKNVGIFFNFTILPPGVSVSNKLVLYHVYGISKEMATESEKDHHQELMKVISWFFFDLLLLGYVEDKSTGLSFRLPRGLEWAIYVEVYCKYIHCCFSKSHSLL